MRSTVTEHAQVGASGAARAELPADSASGELTASATHPEATIRDH